MPADPPPSDLPASDVPTADRPLAGMRIVEVSTFVAAPLGGLTLAQLGADVIRVDPVGGGPDRARWPLSESGASLYWSGLNKHKRSLTVDLRSPEGREIVVDLAAGPGSGGILLTNAAGRSWLGHEALSQIRPDMIHLQIEGHHDGGPAVDYTVNASLGFPAVTGPEGHDGPVNHVLPAWDVACGLYAAVGLLGAERRRRMTGEGQSISVALHDVALATAGNLGFLAEAQLGTARPRIGNHLFGGFARDFATRDGHRLMVVALTGRHWRDLVATAKVERAVTALEGALEADFSDEGDRYIHREVLAGLLQGWFGRHDLEEISAALDGTSVLWSVYRTFHDLFHGDLPGALGARDDVRANPMMGTVDQPGVGPHLAPASPLAFGPRGASAPSRAPLLGEHTGEILADRLGLDADRIRDLHERGVVASARPAPTPNTNPNTNEKD